jgi:xanthine dehydrogenase accessory factor
MLRQDLSGRAAELRAARVPFVHARVVLAERPTSAKPGDEAIILGDGTMEGFVGGACAGATVRRQSIDALASGQPLLLRITPEPEADQAGKRVVHNPCLSGGTLEIFLEPLLAPPLVQVVGQTPTAGALVRLGGSLGYAMVDYNGTVEPDAIAVVVASHGHDEVKALTAALGAGVAYVGLVASRKRGRIVVDSLPVSESTKAEVHTPAGLDIGATTAEEVALSILAEIVASHPRPPRAGRPPRATPSTEIDPVCGMSVLGTDDALQMVHPDPEQGGRTVWFCGPGCHTAFLADAAAFPVSAGH